MAKAEEACDTKGMESPIKDQIDTKGEGWLDCTLSKGPFWNVPDKYEWQEEPGNANKGFSRVIVGEGFPWKWKQKALENLVLHDLSLETSWALGFINSGNFQWLKLPFLY